MTTTIQKWGNSLAVRLPKETVRRLHIREGNEVRIDADIRRIIIRPLLRKKPTLRDLVNRIDSENRHEATDWGKAVGKEVW